MKDFVVVEGRYRTSQTTPLVDTEGKYACRFETRSGVPGNERLVGSVTSAHLFDTEDQAYYFGFRALNNLEHTGMYPNLTAVW